jgi:hypothetical protein
MSNVQKRRSCFSLVMSVNVLVWWTLMPLVFVCYCWSRRIRCRCREM